MNPHPDLAFEPVTVAEAWLGLLAAHGIDILFVNGGTDFAPLAEAYAKGLALGWKMPRPISVPHENVGVAMAHGYTMLTGRAQAMMVHVGPGTANAVNGLYNAYRQRIPMLFTAGRTPVLEAGGVRGSRNNFIDGTGAQSRVACRASAHGPIRAAAITLPVAPAAYAELHEAEVMMKLGEALDVRAAPGPPRVFPAAQRVAHWRNRLPALGRSGRCVAVHISAREPARVWPTEKWISLLKVLKCNVVLLWSPGAADNPRHPGDDEKAAAIATGVGAGVTLAPAKTESLEDLAAVLSLCHAFNGADGGALHLAGGLGLPIVALFENLPYKMRHWRPWQVPYEMVCPQTREIADIPVAAVSAAWARLAARV
jgi:hypothetical protein